jgi:DNA-binding response OmpR family regulator
MLFAAHTCFLSCQRPESKNRLLYLGSNPESLAALRDALRRSQSRIIACPDRGSALLFLESDIPYRLLLIDLDWRGKDEASKLVQLARSLPHRRQMTILILATKSSHMRTVARKAGFDECVTRTTDMAWVAEVVTRLLLLPDNETKGSMSGTDSGSDTGSEPVPTGRCVGGDAAASF